MQSVAPSLRANSNLLSFTSIAIMRDAEAIAAPITADSPMPPRPKMATVAPASTFAVFITAPIPVVTPQPSRQTSSSGASGLTLASDISGSTVYSEKVEQPI